jgi:8-oxo-dGTP pyrophosphatase MutT (NUDIX family)
MFLTLDDLIFPRELESLEERYGGLPREHHRLATGAPMQREWYGRLGTRRGEILLVIERPDGRVLVHTKHEYPTGAYRLLSGGIRWNESVLEALPRELAEETGWALHDERLIGVVSYEFVAERATTPFVSYVFHLPSGAGSPRSRDSTEGISGFRWVTPGEIAGLAESLRRLPEDIPGRTDWARFRAIAHDFVGRLLAGRTADRSR